MQELLHQTIPAFIVAIPHSNIGKSTSIWRIDIQQAGLAIA